MKFNYDVIVVGAGHAGCEAAVASARLGASTLLITTDLNRVAQMSCNPAIGGIAKGQIVREIDALGGQMGIVADRTAIQFRMLNRSKGPAVWSPRVQSDREKYIAEWHHVLETTPGLDLFQDMVKSLDFDMSGEKPVVSGVRTSLGFEFNAKRVVLTNGTFLNGLMHFGATKISGGRIAEPASTGLSDQLRDMGFEVLRMKTGTPARIDGRSIDFSLADRQDGDDEVVAIEATAPGEETRVELVKRDFHKFSFLPEVGRVLPPRSCYIVHTNPEVHKVLHDNLDSSPLYNGQIQSIGPRYCPSIETKIVTFSDKDSHQLFLEPEGATTNEYYINGFSSSLPWEVQLSALQNVPALRDVHFYRPGYAIEYDYFDPTQLTHDLQTKLVDGLYFAGQINGTTGYEEAAAQGLIAGINAARSSKGGSPLLLGRDEAYIGVLIDDLVTKGVDEPYRMFTSRAEYRILLRQDDADSRLTPIGYKAGLADDRRMELLRRKEEMIGRLTEELRSLSVKPTDANPMLASIGSAEVRQSVRAADLILRPGVDMGLLEKYIPGIAGGYSPEVREAVEVRLKYSGYIERERQLAERMGKLDHVTLGDKLDYESITALSTEARQKLKAQRPDTVGQASRIPGVSPADINVLLLLLGK